MTRLSLDVSDYVDDDAAAAAAATLAASIVTLCAGTFKGGVGVVAFGASVRANAVDDRFIKR